MTLQLLLTTLALATLVNGQTRPSAKGDLSRWLTPGNCASSAPGELYIKHIETVARDSERERDDFYEAYARVLAKSTDQQFPDAVKFRKPLLAAFEQTFDFIRTANEGLNGSR